MVEDMKDKKLAEEIVEKLKELVKKGNVTKIQVLKDGETIVLMVAAQFNPTL